MFNVRYQTVQFGQNNTIQYSTVQYSTVQYSTVLYCIVKYSTVFYLGNDWNDGILYGTLEVPKKLRKGWRSSETNSVLVQLLCHVWRNLNSFSKAAMVRTYLQ